MEPQIAERPNTAEELEAWTQLSFLMLDACAQHAASCGEEERHSFQGRMRETAEALKSPSRGGRPRYRDPKIPPPPARKPGCWPNNRAVAKSASPVSVPADRKATNPADGYIGASLPNLYTALRK